MKNLEEKLQKCKVFSFRYIMGEHIPLKFRYSQLSEGNVKAMKLPICMNMHNGGHKR